MLPLNNILLGDAALILRDIESGSIDCCVTSPPYFGLRDYGMPRQIGLEKTPSAFVTNLVNVFEEVKRVLKPKGTLWLNLGDSYAAGGKRRSNEQACRKSTLGGKANQIACKDQPNKIVEGLKPKDLIGVPWAVAFALRASGWYLRQDIIWHKPNPMPESVTDRCTKAHEHLFLLSKSNKYYYDHKAIMVDAKNPEDDFRRYNSQSWDHKNTPDRLRNGIRPRSSGNKARKSAIERGVPGVVNGPTNGAVAGSVPWEGVKANKRSVWTVTTKPYKGAHFAVGPEELFVDCIKAGCPLGGIVLDPFFGAGTTGLVARKLNRNFIGIELNPKYIAIAEKRLKTELGIFL